METKQSLKKIDKNSFEVTNTRVRVVDKKELKREIQELEEALEEKRRLSGVAVLEQKLEEKKALLEQADKLK